MSRYFLEVSYKGTAYAGFQVQQNARTVQEEVEKALAVIFRRPVTCTGSSRTDAGVHARQNYLHFDFDGAIDIRNVYNMNALLPGDIAIRSLRPVALDAHCRFDAVWREYVYRIHGKKNPFIADVAYYFPYRLDMEAMRAAAALVTEFGDFEAFSKRNTQVKTFTCRVMESRWEEDGDVKMYCVRANRFLRGMVRGLVGTMLLVGRGKISVEGFQKILEEGKREEVDFSVPGRGLCLERVEFAEGYFG